MIVSMKCRCKCNICKAGIACKYLMNFNSTDKLPVKVFGKPSFVKEYENENGKPGETNAEDVEYRRKKDR